MNRREIFKLGGAAAAVATIPARALAAGPKQSPDYTRVSTEEGDAGYVPYGHLMADGRWPTVYLDGVKQDGCLTADSNVGMIKRYVQTEHGNYAAVGNKLLTETVYGRVLIEVPPYEA
jgi:hypothetical protein